MSGGYIVDNHDWPPGASDDLTVDEVLDVVDEFDRVWAEQTSEDPRRPSEEASAP